MNGMLQEQFMDHQQLVHLVFDESVEIEVWEFGGEK